MLNHLKHSTRSSCAAYLAWISVFGTFQDNAGLFASDLKQEFAFELVDQFGERHSAAQMTESPTVLIGGDRESRQLSQAWAVAVRDLLDGDKELSRKVEVLRVADLRGVPGFLRARVTKQLQRSLEMPLLLDWDGQVVGRYEFQPEVANVILLDSGGSVAWRTESRGPRGPEMDELKQALLDLEEVTSSESNALLQPTMLGSCL